MSAIDLLCDQFRALPRAIGLRNSIRGVLTKSLASLIPNWAYRRDLILYALVTHSEITIRDRKGTFSLSSNRRPGVLAAAMELAKKHNAERIVWVLELPPEQQLVSEFHMPRLSEWRMREAVACQLELLYPFPIDQLYFDYRIADDGTASGAKNVKAVASPRSVVQPLMERLATAQISVDQLCPIDEPNFNMLPPTERPNSQISSGRLGALASAAAILVFVAIMLPLWLQSQLVDEAERQAASAFAQMTPLLEQRNQLQAELGAIVNVRANPSSDQNLSALLHQLSLAMGTASSLQRLVYRAGEMQLAGVAPNTKELIDRLAKSESFESPLVVTPAIVDPATGAERFNLKVPLKVVRGGND